MKSEKLDALDKAGVGKVLDGLVMAQMTPPHLQEDCSASAQSAHNLGISAALSRLMKRQRDEKQRDSTRRGFEMNCAGHPPFYSIDETIRGIIN